MATRKQFISSTALTLSALAFAGLPVSGNSARDKLRLGIIGTGNRGTGLISTLLKLEAFDIVGYCDIREDNLKRAGDMLSSRARQYRDYRRLLDNREIDAVIIATPLYLHYQMVVDAVDAGKHVYVEKTMTYDIPQSLDLVRKMQQSRLVLQVGYQYRYYGLYYKVKQIMEQNWLGKVTHFECQYHRNSNWRSPVTDPKMEKAINWRMYKAYSGGLMAELCAHQIDVVNWMLDAHPLKVAGMGGINYWKDGRETYDNVRAVFEYPGGVKLSASSVLSNAFNGYTIKLLGDKATLEIQRDTIHIYPEAVTKELGTVDGVSGATITNRTQGQAVPVPFEYLDASKREATAYSLIDFAKCIATGKKVVSDVLTGRDAAVSVHLANKAMETGTTQYWQSEYSS